MKQIEIALNKIYFYSRIWIFSVTESEVGFFKRNEQILVEF